MNPYGRRPVRVAPASNNSLRYILIVILILGGFLFFVLYYSEKSKPNTGEDPGTEDPGTEDPGTEDPGLKKLTPKLPPKPKTEGYIFQLETDEHYENYCNGVFPTTGINPVFRASLQNLNQEVNHLQEIVNNFDKKTCLSEKDRKKFLGGDNADISGWPNNYAWFPYMPSYHQPKNNEIKYGRCMIIGQGFERDTMRGSLCNLEGMMNKNPDYFKYVTMLINDAGTRGIWFNPKFKHQSIKTPGVPQATPKVGPYKDLAKSLHDHRGQDTTLKGKHPMQYLTNGKDYTEDPSYRDYYAGSFKAWTAMPPELWSENVERQLNEAYPGGYTGAQKKLFYDLKAMGKLRINGDSTDRVYIRNTNGTDEYKSVPPKNPEKI